MENEKPKPYQEFTLGGIKFEQALWEQSLSAARETGIKNEEILSQTSFQIYYNELQLKSINRIRNNVVFWFWVTAGWILLVGGSAVGLGVLF